METIGTDIFADVCLGTLEKDVRRESVSSCMFSTCRIRYRPQVNLLCVHDKLYGRFSCSSEEKIPKRALSGFCNDPCYRTVTRIFV